MEEIEYDYIFIIDCWSQLMHGVVHSIPFDDNDVKLTTVPVLLFKLAQKRI
jgi:hypothetical protein